MEHIKDLKWKKGITVRELVEMLSRTGFQSIELGRASDVIVKMKRDGAKIFLTYPSNLATSGLRGFFAQLIELGIVDVIVTTIGGIEEDIMKALGERFLVGRFDADDLELFEKGINRVGNIYINNESYMKFEDFLNSVFKELYKKKRVWAPSEVFREIGKMINDENSILYQASKHSVPIFCPAITDGAFGFHLYMFKQKHKDFNIDVVEDFKNILFCTSYDDKKGVIALGGGVSKHHAILATLINGGADYAIYITTSHYSSGSVSGATTKEAKSWGKVKDDADIATVIGDATIIFPLVMFRALEELDDQGLLRKPNQKK